MKKSLLGLLFLLALASCGGSKGAETRERAAQKKQNQKSVQHDLKVAVTPTLDCLPLILAQNHGLFDTLAVHLKLDWFHAHADCDTAFAGGSVQGMFSDAVRAEMLRGKGTAPIYFSSTNLSWQLITNRKVRLRKVSQLGDKMVAVAKYSATDCLTEEVLRGVKTSAAVFRVQINSLDTRLRMLRINQMDAMWLPEPYATIARTYRHPVIAESEKMKDDWGVIVFRQDAWNDKQVRRKMEIVAKGYDLAVDSLNENGVKKYAPLLKKYYHLDDKTIDNLPKLQFKHIGKPGQQTIEKAKKFVSNIQSTH